MTSSTGCAPRPVWCGHASFRGCCGKAALVQRQIGAPVKRSLIAYDTSDQPTFPGNDQGARLLMEAALEAGSPSSLAGTATSGPRRVRTSGPGSRNGYREVTVKTTAGPVQLSRPKLRDTTEAFASRLCGSHVTKGNALESLVIASIVRSLPPRTGASAGPGH